MDTTIVLPDIGEITFNTDLIPVDWDDISTYLNTEPPYKGESPGEGSFLKLEKDGTEILVFNSSLPGVICMFINELMVDMYCVYDCENLIWPYGGMPYGCNEIGYTSIEQMPSFCQNILKLFIDLGIVLKLQGNPVGDYYVIPNYKEYFPLESRLFRRKQTYLWHSVIEPQIKEFCKRWLSHEIITVLEEYANADNPLAEWYNESILFDIQNKSLWAQSVLNETVNDYIRDKKVTLFYLYGRVNVKNKESLITPFPEDYVCTNFLFSKNQAFLKKFHDSDWITLGDLLLDHSSAISIIENLEPINFDFYFANNHSLHFSFNKERCEYSVSGEVLDREDKKAGDRLDREIIATISDLKLVKMKYKEPIHLVY